MKDGVMPLASVVIVTHNRRPYLVKALAGLAEQTLPQSSFEVIVVDNASTDDTRAFVESAATPSTNIRYILEPTLGANIARNTGWHAARSQYVAYLDDDAIPCAEWVERIVRVFEE